MDENIEIDVDELSEQLRDEIKADPHSVIIEICVPGLVIDGSGKKITHTPASQVRSGAEGTNKETVASAVMCLEKVKEDLLKDPGVHMAYLLLKMLCEDSTIVKSERKNEDDSDSNS